MKGKLIDYIGWYFIENGEPYFITDINDTYKILCFALYSGDTRWFLLNEERDIYNVMDLLLPYDDSEWLTEDDSFIGDIYRCKKCNKLSINKTNYCGNCGRKMEM